MVEIEAINKNYLYRQYDSETKTWSEEKILPHRPAIQLAEFDQLKAEKEALANEVVQLKSISAMNLKTLAN